MNDPRRKLGRVGIAKFSAWSERELYATSNLDPFTYWRAPLNPWTIVNAIAHNGWRRLRFVGEWLALGFFMKECGGPASEMFTAAWAWPWNEWRRRRSDEVLHWWWFHPGRWFHYTFIRGWRV